MQVIIDLRSCYANEIRFLHERIICLQLRIVGWNAGVVAAIPDDDRVSSKSLRNILLKNEVIGDIAGCGTSGQRTAHEHVLLFKPGEFFAFPFVKPAKVYDEILCKQTVYRQKIANDRTEIEDYVGC